MQIFTNRGDNVDNRRVVKRYVLILQSPKKNLFVDNFHFLLDPLPWQRSKTGAQNVSVRVKGHMNYGLTFTEGLILIDPELIIFGRPQSSPVSRCYNVDPEIIHRLVAAPASERL